MPETADDTATAAATAGTKRPRSDEDEAAAANDESAAATSAAAPLTADGEMPQKKFYRSRAHVNPLSHNNAYEYPTTPTLLDWTAEHYPHHPDLAKDASSNASSSSASASGIVPNVLDIGCGFGGLTIALSTLLPTKTILGLEIRDKVTEYVRLRIAALRKEHPLQYQNASVLRSNTMKFMPNLFGKSTLDKIFFCFPDPHFKRKNHPRRIVSDRLLTEYAYFLKPTVGRLYCITDVEELHNWHVRHCRSHPLFRELTQEEMEDDPCVAAMRVETEEGKKVERAGNAKYYAVYQRRSEEEVVGGKGMSAAVTAGNFWTEGEFGVRKMENKE